MMILEELQLPYTTHTIPFDEIKGAFFTSKNPNGRAPAMEDPNNGLVIWESGAIIQYIIETYDKECKLTHGPGTLERHLENQYMHFQMSGQGPYYGQAMWFASYHPEDVPSAKERYLKEVNRVLGVLDKILEKNEWLVGTKCTYADISFMAWDYMIPLILEKNGKQEEWARMEADFPNWWKWHMKLRARPAVKKVNDFVDKKVIEFKEAQRKKQEEEAAAKK
jgi:glutathione S-transferase